MKLKLRRVVMYVPTKEGILFRMGDTFLPMKGNHIFQWFQRVEPFLNGCWTAEQLCAQVGQPQWRILEKVLNALQEAGMLYLSEDHPTALADPVRNCNTAFINRLEAHSQHPCNSYTRFRQMQILVIGHAQIVLELAAAGIEMGVLKQTVSAIDWSTVKQSRVDELIRSSGGCQTDGQQGTVEIAESFPTAANFDCTIVAGFSETDWDWMEMAARSSSTSGGTAPITMVVHPSFVIAGPLSQGIRRGCVRCMRFVYEQKVNSVAYMSLGVNDLCKQETRLRVGIAAASRLLMQKLLDFQVTEPEKDQGSRLLDLDLTTMHISERPMPVSTECLCYTKTLDSFVTEVNIHHLPSAIRPGAFSLSNDESREAESQQFLEQVYHRLVDPITGLIERIEEGDLLQFPHYQSAVWWRPDGRGGRLVLTTEAAENVLMSRVEAVRRTLEQYLNAWNIRNRGSHVDKNWSDDCQGDDAEHGVVVSGVYEEELKCDCFFQSLAAKAFEDGGWSEIDVPFRTGEASADLTLAYLDDVGLRQGLCVSRHKQFSTHGCEVLRFDFNLKPISILAGPIGPELWLAGLRDVWLYICRGEVATGVMSPFPHMRLRSPHGLASLRWTVMQRLQDILHMQISIAPVFHPELRFIKNFMFVRGYLKPASMVKPPTMDRSSVALNSTGQALDAGNGRSVNDFDGTEPRIESWRER